MHATFNVKQGKIERERMALRLTHSSRKETRQPLHQKKREEEEEEEVIEDEINTLISR